MAALSRLQSLKNNTLLQILIHRHLHRSTAAAAAAQPFNISPVSQPSVQFDLQNVKYNNKLSANANEFVVNLNFPIGLSMMELCGSRSTSSKKNRPDLVEYIEYDDEIDFDDGDDDDDDDDEYGSGSDSGDDDGRRGGGRGLGGGSRGVVAYTV